MTDCSDLLINEGNGFAESGKWRAIALAYALIESYWSRFGLYLFGGLCKKIDIVVFNCPFDHQKGSV